MNLGCLSFAVIGGDRRQLYCAKSLANDGYAVTLGGFDNIVSMSNIEIASPFESALSGEIIVLPLPCTDKSGRIPCEFSPSHVALSDSLVSAMQGKRIFCGMKQRLLDAAPSLNPSNVYDYYAREEFAVCNAVVTAEGAIEIAMSRYPGTVNSSRCLVCGWGRIGKALTRMLVSLNADVTVSARKSADLAWISLSGAKAVKTSELEQCQGFDIIFNTVPARIFGCELLAKVALNAVVIDLASGEGGTDKRACERMNIDLVHALSLPGRAAPKTAGEIVKNTIHHILEEENR